MTLRFFLLDQQQEGDRRKLVKKSPHGSIILGAFFLSGRQRDSCLLSTDSKRPGLSEKEDDITMFEKSAKMSQFRIFTLVIPSV